MTRTYSRRRAIMIFAAAAGLPLLTRAQAAESPLTWSGQALGAPATLILNHADRPAARRMIERVVAEVARLESIFSLYRDDSALSTLNRVGVLVAPPPELVALLRACGAFHQATGGAFDPTVQPVWALYRDHFSALNPDPAGPSAAKMRRVLKSVGFERIAYDGDRVSLPKGAALTLNGVAQGFITDRVVDLLKDAGVTSSLVDMGEDRVIGTRPDGSLWRIGLAEHEDAQNPDQVLEIVDKAVATSSAEGFHFDPAGRFGHIIDPRDGSVPTLYRRVSVVAGDAQTADAMSTAFCLMPEPDIAAIVDNHPALTVDLVDIRGKHKRMLASA
jgi:thiamine biosynthesis lipoprotein